MNKIINKKFYNDMIKATPKGEIAGILVPSDIIKKIKMRKLLSASGVFLKTRGIDIEFRVDKNGKHLNQGKKFWDIRPELEFPDDDCRLTAYNRILRVKEIEDFLNNRIIDLKL